MATVDSVGTTRYVCPLCERTFGSRLNSCPDCDSTLVVPIEDGTVYATVLPMCGR